jgi:hypothetical protein
MVTVEPESAFVPDAGDCFHTRPRRCFACCLSGSFSMTVATL